MDRFVVISGCSGGGKSTLVAELGRRGHAVIGEPGRRIVNEELLRAGTALPWVDPLAFAQRAVTMALADREAACQREGWVFFDRSLVDAAAALEHATGEPQLEQWCRSESYHPVVFMAPPWPEIFVVDDARRHEISAAVAEYERLLAAYSSLGYATEILPRVGVSERANLVLRRLV